MAPGFSQPGQRTESASFFGSFTVNALKLKKSVLTPSGPIYSDVLEVPL